MSRLAMIFSTLFLLTVLSSTTVDGSSKLLLVGIDGFRWDMDRLEDLPNLAAFSAEGVKVPYVTPPFTTLTYPVIFTIFTGLYPESHGCLTNILFDLSAGKILGDVDNATKASEVLDDGVELIWVTASRQGKRTGTYMVTPIPGNFPDVYRYVPYAVRNQTYSSMLRAMDMALGWLYQDNMDFVVFYIGTLDVASHYYGPESSAARASLKEIDGVIGYMLQQVKQLGLTDLNIILTSDHGFENLIDTPNPIEIYKYVNESSLQFLIADDGPLALIQPAPGRREEVYAALSGRHPNMTVYYKEDFPTRFHYANSPRMPEIIAMADTGYFIYSRYEGSPPWKGYHGYDNQDMNMKALFRAWGPNFRRGYVRSDPFDLVHIYPLMCAILGVEPAPNNGSLEEVKDLLVGMSGQGALYSGKSYVLLIAMLFVAMVM